VRESVERAFTDAGAIFEWLPMQGDPTRDAARRWGRKIASPTLRVVVSGDGDARRGELVDSVRNWIGPALARIRRDRPELPVDVRSLSGGRACTFAFARSASAESITEGLARIRQADTGSEVLGWDDDLMQWVRL
jgi:hypothetical protein